MLRALLFRLFCPHLKAHVWPSSNHRVTLSGFRVPFRDEYYLSPALSEERAGIDMMRLSGDIGSKLDMFHEQLPLPVPCYDLVFVTEFAVVLREADLRAPPAPLT